MEVSVLKTLKRLRKEAPRRYTELRDACDELIGAVTGFDAIGPSYKFCRSITSTVNFWIFSMTVSLTALIGTHSAAYNDNDADKYFGPYQAACDSRQPRLMEIALDGLHNLIGNVSALHLIPNYVHSKYPIVVTTCRAWFPPG